MSRYQENEPLLEASEEGAYSFSPGLSVEEFRRQIGGREFQALQRRLREVRRADDWGAALLCSIHRDIFGEHFPESAGRLRMGELNFGRRAALRPEHIESALQQLVIALRHELRWAQSRKSEFDEVDAERLFLEIARHHAELIRIHPFVDGNGRWARFITSIFLCDAGFGCGTMIYARDRDEYIRAIDRIIDGNEPGDLADLLLTGYLDQAERRFSGTRPKTP